MYQIPYYKEKDQKVVLEFIQKHPFAFLTGCDENQRPVATQIPVFVEQRHEKLYLFGHMTKGADHYKAFKKNPNVLCVFTGHHTYVSASWYSNPNQASTWNYISVHVKGQIRFLNSEGLEEVLKKTSLHFENNNHLSPTAFDNLPEEYRSRLMKAIDAFEIEVEQIDNVFKLSQNRDQESYLNIIEKLEAQDESGKFIANEMKKRQEDLFG